MDEPIDELRTGANSDTAESEQRVQRIMRRTQLETASGDALTFVALRMWGALVIVGAVMGAILGRRRPDLPARDG